MYLPFFSLNQGTAIAANLFVARRKESKQCQWKEREAWVKRITFTHYYMEITNGARATCSPVPFKIQKLQFTVL
jgi:hypothetical protein